MKILIIGILILFTKNFCVGQENRSIYGKYVNKADSAYPMLTEAISLNRDSTFQYVRRMELWSINIVGYWQIQNGYLLLTSKETSEKIINVNESYDLKSPSSKTKIQISDFQNYPIHCVIIVNEGEKNFEKKYDVWDTITLSNVHINTITFYSNLKISTYFLKKCNSNFLRVKINPKRILIKEKWLIIGKQIIPKGLDGEYVPYTLEKKEDF